MPIRKDEDFAPEAAAQNVTQGFGPNRCGDQGHIVNGKSDSGSASLPAGKFRPELRLHNRRYNRFWGTRDYAASPRITDHDEFAGSLALLRGRPDLDGRIAIGEEVSVWYQGHLFHLGVSGLPESGIDATHSRIQSASRGGRHDELFETLAASGSLVVLNHPLVSWRASGRSPANTAKSTHRRIDDRPFVLKWSSFIAVFIWSRGRRECYTLRSAALSRWRC
jgi:hypothetical protein